MKRVLLLTTGGTIACRQTEQGLRPLLTGEDFMRPEIASICRPDILNLLQVDSTDIRYPQMYTIAQSIWERAAAYDGFVVTHGTDTMAYTAAFLSWALENPGKPVILTGSMLPFGVPDSDAPGNLTGALLCAASAYQGVGLYDNGKLFYGREVTKADAERKGAFAAPYSLPDGIMTAAGELQLTQLRKAEGKARLLPFPRGTAALVRLTPLTEPEQLLRLGDCCRAVILEAFGAGGLPAVLTQAVETLCRQGIRVYMKSQCWTGKANLRKYEVGRRALALGVVDLGGMTAENALAAAVFGA